MTTTTAAPTIVGTAPGGGMTIEEGVAAMAAARQQTPRAPAQPDKPAEAGLDGQAPDRDPDTPETAPGDGREGVDEAEPDDAEGGEESEAAEEAGDEADGGEGDKVVLPDGSEIPVDELVRGYQRQSDYTKKTQALAEERRTLDAERQTVASRAQEIDQLRARFAEREQTLGQELARYQGVLQELGSKLETDDPFKDLDWERLLDENPIEFQRQQLRHTRWQEQHGKAKAALLAEQRAAEERLRAQHQAALEERKQGLRQWVRQHHPEWADPERGAPHHEAMLKTAVAAGYTPDEVGATLDPRGWEILHKAAEYDRLMARAGSATRDATPGPDGRIRIVKAQASAPRSTPTTVKKAALASSHARLERTGSLDDALAALQAQRAYRSR